MLADTLLRSSLRKYLVRGFLISLNYLRAGTAVTGGTWCSSHTRLQSNLRIVQCLAAAVCLFLSPPSPADVRLDALVKGTDVTPPVSGLQITVIEDGEVSRRFAMGLVGDRNGRPTRLNQNHKMRVASISKLVVAIGVMRLVQQEDVDLDADVSGYLGWTLRNPNHPKQIITLRQLLSHTSSVRDAGKYFIAAGQGELRDFFDPDSTLWSNGAHWAPQAEAPGVYFEYANLNFGAIAEVIERVSARRFDQFMREEVLRPLGLAADFNACEVPRAELGGALSKRFEGYEWHPERSWMTQVDGAQRVCFYGDAMLDDPALFLAGYELGSNATLFSPQGGLRASADDLATIMQLLINKGSLNGRQLLTPTSVDAMLKPVWQLSSSSDNGLSAGEAQPGGDSDGLMTSYGLSVHRIDMRAWGFQKGPRYLVGHLGQAYGVLSHALFDPVSGDGIVTIVGGTGDKPDANAGHSPLYRLEEELLHWWINHRESGGKEVTQPKIMALPVDKPLLQPPKT